MSKEVDRLLERRLLIVSGKGGTGKTALVATLGLLAARRGIETAVVELGDDAALPRLLGHPSAPEGDGRTPVELERSLHHLRIVPEVSLLEYLELQLRVAPLARMLIGNPGLQRLLEFSPGWRELITLGKLWHLETRENPRWGLIVVDAPATGHGLSFLSVPGVVVEAVRLGPLHRHTDRVQELLCDPARTLVVPVTLPEELPIRETIELVAGVRALGVGVGPLIANAVECLGRPDDESALRAATLLPDESDLGDGLSAAAVRACAAHALRRAELHTMFLDQLRAEADLRALHLPYLVNGVTARADVERLADALERAEPQ